MAGAAGIAQRTDGHTPGEAAQQGLGLAAAQTTTAQNASMDFGALFHRASYGNLETSYNTIAVQNANLNMLLSTNVRCIRIDIGYAPWLQKTQTAITEITSLVQSVREAGKCLIIADAASETYRKAGALPWSQFEAAWAPRVSTLAALYHPDYYIVIKEPGWYVPFVSDATTNPQFQNMSVWVNLTQDLTKAVQAASPSTVVGVAIAANSLVQANGAFYAQYLNQVQKISGISFIGFDIYGQGDQTATKNYISQNPPSKPVWIPEAWSTADGSPLNGDPNQDAQWMRSIYSFASSIHAAFLIPFYTNDFASYTLTTSPPTDSAQIVSLYQQRTPVFLEFQSVIATASALSTTTSSGSVSASASSSAASAATSSTSSLTKQSPSSSSSSTAGATSSASTQSTTPGTPTGERNGLFSPAVVGLEIVALIALVGVILYFRMRRR